MKKFVAILAAVVVSSLFIAACDSSERNKANSETIKGTAQETAGDITNDNDLKVKGKVNRLKGDLRNTKEDVKDFVSGD